MYEMNVKKVDDAVTRLEHLIGITFSRSDEMWRETAGVSVSAARRALPQSIDTDGHGNDTVNYGAIVGLLVEAFKEQQQQIAELRAELAKRKTMVLPKK